jgi:hypothetical protein
MAECTRCEQCRTRCMNYGRRYLEGATAACIWSDQWQKVCGVSNGRMHVMWAMAECMWHEKWQEDKGVNNDSKYQLQVLLPTDLVTKTPSLSQRESFFTFRIKRTTSSPHSWSHCITKHKVQTKNEWETGKEYNSSSHVQKESRVLEKASQTLYHYRQKLMSLQSSLVRLGLALAAQDAGLVCMFFFRNTFDTL